MAKLPTASILELEPLYFPWGDTMRKVIKIAVEQIPQGASVLDVMCGSGLLLGILQALRPDLKLTGVDINEDFIAYAKRRYDGIVFEVCHVLGWLNDHTDEFDVVLCTGGIHHLSFEKQSGLISGVASHIKRPGFFISAEPYIAPFSNEHERRIAAVKLDTQQLLATFEKFPPQAIIEVALDILRNDLLLDGEYKNSLEKSYEVFSKYFKKIETICTWSAGEHDGEYVIVAHK